MKRTFALLVFALASVFVSACSSTVSANKPCTSPAATNCTPYFGGNSDASTVGSKGGNAGTGSSAGSSAGNSGKGGLGAGNGKGGNAGGKGR